MSYDSAPWEEKYAPIVELALLRLLAPFTFNDASVYTNLSLAKQVLQSNSENPFYIYAEVEDPSYIYLIGS